VIITCPKCFSADDVLPPRRLPDRLLQYRCTNQVHGDHEWLTTRDDLRSPSDVQEGVTDDLLEPLNHCVDAGDPFLEYGVVEHRLAHTIPRPVRRTRRRTGTLHVRLPRVHRLQRPLRRRPRPAGRTSASPSAGWKGKGDLVSEYGPATGAWHHNSRVTYWARTPPPDRRRKTWTECCTEIGRSPEWTDDDRLGLHTP
jgi:hypothetical protein